MYAEKTGAGKRRFWPGRRRLRAVSYTHLDVYKRQLQNIAQKAGQLAHLHAADHHHVAAEPEKGDNRGIHDELETGHVENSQMEGMAGGLLEFLIDLGKLLFFIALPDIGLDHADGGQVFLHDRIDVIQRPLHFAIRGAQPAQDEDCLLYTSRCV